MFAKTLFTAAIALVSFTASTAALANEGYDPLPVSTTTTLTRADVRAEATQARTVGFVTHGDKTVFLEPVGMAKTRAQVQAETLEAIRLGAISKGEHNTFPTAEQLQRIEMAGQAALKMMVAAR